MAPTLGAPSIPAVDEAEQLRLELYEACRARTRGWVERRIHSRVASFHLHWHDDCGAGSTRTLHPQMPGNEAAPAAARPLMRARLL